MFGNPEMLYISIGNVIFYLKIIGPHNHFLYNKLKSSLKNFVIIHGKANYSVIITISSSERIVNFKSKPRDLLISVSIRILKNTKLYRLFLDSLFMNLRTYVFKHPDVVLLHSSACAKDNKAYLFLGPSNSGKSTVVRLLRGYSVISDDKVLIRQNGKRFYILPLPILSYEYSRVDKELQFPVVVEKIFILEKSNKLLIKKVSPGIGMIALFERMKDLSHISHPNIQKIFSFSYRIAHSLPIYSLFFYKNSPLSEALRHLHQFNP